jgi:hypothetical protein
MQIALAKTAQAALKRLARPGMMLRPDARGGFCVGASEDGRRRAAARVSALEARTMASEGLIEACGEQRFHISAAGRAFLTRAESGLEATPVPAADHVPQSAALRRLRVLAGAHGGFFSAAELRAAERLERDHRLAQLQGRVTADWGAPPMERTARGPGTGMMGPEAAMDARNRLAAMRARIGPEASDFLADLFWSEVGIEEAERRRQWPPRSGKVALKLILGALSAPA